MNIVFTSDNNFVRQMSAAIISILENNKDEQIKIYILSKGIEKANQDCLLQMVKDYDQEMFVIELGDVHQYFETKIDTGGWNDIVLSRLFLDRILPRDVERVIYLDGDVIVRHSLKSLWNTDLKG